MTTQQQLQEAQATIAQLRALLAATEQCQADSMGVVDFLQKSLSDALSMGAALARRVEQLEAEVSARHDN